MNPDHKSPLTPLFQFIRTLPLLPLSLLLIPFLAPTVTEMIVSPLLPLVRVKASGDDPSGQSLHQQLAQERQENARLRALIENINQLKQEEASQNGLLASYLGQSPRLFHHGLILDRGSLDGVSVDSIVMHTGTLIGVIDDVKDHWCHAQLVTDPNFSISVEIVGHNDRPLPHEGWIKGVCGGRVAAHDLAPLEVRHVAVARKDDCHIGDYIITSGVDFKAPPGLLLGRVTDISQLNTDTLFLNISVNIEKDPMLLPLFSILPPPDNPFQTVSAPR